MEFVRIEIITGIVASVLTVLFLLYTFLIKRSKFLSIFRGYFRIYRGAIIEEKGSKRYVSLSQIIIFGLFPYLIGFLLAFSIREFLMSIDQSLVLQVNIILLTVLCLFFGLDFSKDRNSKSTRIIELLREVDGVILISLVLLILNSMILIVAYNLFHIQIGVFILCAFYAIESKIVILFLVLLKRIYKLKNDEIHY